MACYHPLTAYRGAPGEKIRFTEGGDSGSEISLPCGRCIGCRLVRQRNWATRCMHEAQMHDQNCFITLTYDEDHYAPGLNHKDWQQFMYRLRKRHGPTRFFMCGEYGDLNNRPHFHGLLFGLTFTDGVQCGQNLYHSKTLEHLWPHGFSSFGELTQQSAAYVARYSLKKITGDLAEEHYKRVNLTTGEIIQVQPEYGRMSLKPGIGYTWFKKYWKEVYKARDGIVAPGGYTTPPPRYYDQLLEKTDRKLRTEKEIERYEKMKIQENKGENTTERLKVKETVTLARIKHYQRTKL